MHVVVNRRTGAEYHYAWRGGPRLPEPHNPIEYHAAYAEALKQRDAPPINGPTFLDLILEYKSSPEWERLSDSSRDRREWRIKRIRERFGDLSLYAIQAQAMREEFWAWRDEMKATPKAADDHIELLNVILNWAAKRGKIQHNRASGIEALYKRNRSDAIFDDDALARILAACAPDLARLVRIAVYTGLRRSDLVALDWRHIREGVIEKPTDKSRERVTTFLPILPELEALLGARGADDAPVLTMDGGKRWVARSITNRFNFAMERAGVTARRFHDLRGTACTALVKAGLSDREIEEWMGWEEGQAKMMRKRYVSRLEVAEELAKKLRALDSRPARAA